MTTVPSRYRVSDIISRTRHAFGDEDSVQILDSDIIGWINEAINTTANLLKYVQGTATTSITAGNGTIAMPTVNNIIEIASIEVNGVPVPFIPFAEHQTALINGAQVQGVSTGEPQYWTRWGDTLRFYPDPDTTYPVVLYYIGLPDPVVNTSDMLPFPDRYFSGICQFVMMRAYELDEDYDAQRASSQEYERLMNLTLENEGEQQALLYPTIQLIE